MNATEIMKKLKKLGTAQNVKIYKRHGSGDNVYGVSFANLEKLKKTIKTNHELSINLWDTGNVDAQALSLMIADPDTLTAKTIDTRAKGLKYSLLIGMYGGLVAKSKFGDSRMKLWMKSKQDHLRQLGYDILCSRLKRGDAPTEKKCLQYLQTIEKEIHDSPNRSRYSMNNALIALGIYQPQLTDRAIEAARRIGKVDVDHGETSCKTPDAESYIKKALARQKKK